MADQTSPNFTQPKTACTQSRANRMRVNTAEAVDLVSMETRGKYRVTSINTVVDATSVRTLKTL